MQLIIMRHGQTDYNAQHRYAGTLDIPLNEAGRAEARRAGIVASVPLVYTSHLARARETAHICFPQATAIARPNLAEMNFGAFQGKTPDEMEHYSPYREWVANECRSRCPQGEAPCDFIERVSREVSACLAEQAAQRHTRTIIVAHGGTIMATLFSMACAEEQRDYFAWTSKNCCGYKAEVVGGEKPASKETSTAKHAQTMFELHSITSFDRLDFLA